MIWRSKSKKCSICEVKFSLDVPFHEMRVNTDEGVVSLEICEECADFFDKSADILRKSRNQEAEDESI